MRQNNKNHKCPLCGSQLTQAKYHQIVDIGNVEPNDKEEKFHTIKAGRAVINKTRDTFLKPALKNLANLQIALDKKGTAKDGSIDGDLFEEILAIQDDILNSFGLPTNSKFEDLLYFKTKPTEEEINQRITKLRKAATTYLLKDAKPDLQVLREAQESNQDPFMVLPELKVPTHIYTLFVYEQILLKHKDSIENILNDLKLVSEDEILGKLGLLGLGGLKRNKLKVIDDLKKKGVRYVQQFMAHTSN